MNPNEKLDAAIQLAAKHHSGQLDKSGVPYICHVMVVICRVDTVLLKTIAALHDIVEDTDVTALQIENTFGSKIADAVTAITKIEGEDYNEYLERVKKNEYARVVKLADLSHNMDLRRLNDEPSEKDISRRAKYDKAMKYLSGVQ